MIRSSMAGTCLGIVAGLVLATAASAQTQQVCFDDAISLQSTNWAHSVTIPKFDTGLGTLQQIDFTLTGNVQGTAQVENEDASPTVVNLQFSATLTLTRPDTSVIVVTIPLANFNDPLAAYDGTTDFMGPSGATHTGINATQSNMATSPPPASDLTLFSGPAGNPGTITLPVSAVASSVASGGGNITSHFVTSAAAMVHVCYTYAPNTPPFFTSQVCGTTLMATAGVPVSFQVCAQDSDPTDPVTITGTIPAGATTTPPLPASGNPICIQVDWTPTINDVGTAHFNFTATDSHGRTAHCDVDVITAECYQFIGRGGGGSTITIGGVPFNSWLSSIRSYFPVTMTNRPNLRVPLIASGQINFSFETVMHNPWIFPNNPEQWSQRLHVTVLPGGVVQGELLDSLNGIHQFLSTFTDPTGVLYMTFPFTIDGM